jgi:hypothetical protein
MFHCPNPISILLGLSSVEETIGDVLSCVNVLSLRVLLLSQLVVGCMPHPTLGAWHHILVLQDLCVVMRRKVFIIASPPTNHSSSTLAHYLRFDPRARVP